MRNLRLILVLFSVLMFSATSQAGMYLQAEANQVDVSADVPGVKVDGSGFGARVGYVWKTFGLEAGYSSASAELDGYLFSPTDKYEVDYKFITAGARWWIASWFDLSFGLVSVKGDMDMSLTMPILGTVAANGSFDATGYYIGAGFNIPFKSFDLFIAYNMYRWSDEELDGSTASSDTGINTLAAGLRIRF